jgi:hypothetical protein
MMKFVGDLSGPAAYGVITGGLMEKDEDRRLRQRLAQLKREHRDLDEAISALEGAYRRDQLMLTRLKKKKLCLRDEIARIEDLLFPDIIA